MAARISDLIGQWALRPGPLHDRLTAALRDAVRRGDLPAGTRLPAERALARILSVSRGTVATAYRTLAREGLLEGRQGSGTYVRAASIPRSGSGHHVPPARLPRALAMAPADVPRDGSIDLTSATSTWLNLFSDDLLAGALAEPGLARSHGYAPVGIEPLRAAVAQWMSSQGLPTSESQILVTTGAQQAIVLIAGLFARRGDRVALEDPTYTGAIDALTATGAAMRSVPVDGDGVRTDVLRDLLEREPIRLVYLVATLHNPTGAVLSAERRQEVARLARELDIAVVDDMAMAGLWLDAPPPPPVAAFDPEAPVLTVGSLSKLFWGGLRIGWIRAPEHLMPALIRLKAVADLGSSMVSQALGAALLSRVDEVAERRRRELASSTALICDLLSDLLPDWTWERPRGGVTLWARLPYGDAEELGQLAARQGVLVLPGNIASPENGHRDRLRIPLLREPAELEEGIKRLALAWDSYVPTPATEQPALLRVIV